MFSKDVAEGSVFDEEPYCDPYLPDYSLLSTSFNLLIHGYLYLELPRGG